MFFEKSVVFLAFFCYNGVNEEGWGDAMHTVNEKIINAIIEKANKVCPNSLALIGIYGSYATGDVHAKSDLDLLILIQDDEGYKLATGFILSDKGIGYDIYCMSRERLRDDAACHHAQLARLMDSKIVYVKDQSAYDELLLLREKAKALLASEARFDRVAECLRQAKLCYANACLSDKLGEVRLEAFGVIQSLLDAVMLYHGRYFKLGVKRVFEELATLPIDTSFADTIQKIVMASDMFELRALLKSLILYTEGYMHKEKIKEKPSEALSGTYEEIYSNWRGKMEEAAERGDAYSSFANLCCSSLMLKEIAEGVDVGSFALMDAYCPHDLNENVAILERALERYEEVYRQAGIKIKRFANVDAFVASYWERG